MTGRVPWNRNSSSRIFDGSEKRDVAVRTSLDGEVGFARHADGSWITIPKVDEVLVVASSAEEPGSAEVFCFDRDVLIEAFDAALVAQKKQYLNFSHKAPVFLPLDGAGETDWANASSGLKAKAKWQTLVPLSAVSTGRSSSGSIAEGFIDRVKREFAQMNGVDVSKVVIEFKIIT
jgi:hypothetical protein